MDQVKILGLLAALFITIANFPQTYKMIKTRSANDISAPTYILLVIGNAAWLAYGIINDDLPLVIGNSISTLMCALILFIKFTSDKAGQKPQGKVVPRPQQEKETQDG